MSRIPHAILHASLGVCLLGAFTACRPAIDVDEPVLRVGVIAPLRGPARAWGVAAVRSAQVVADYHNAQGGFDLGGRRVKVELVVKDDGYDPAASASAAHDLVLEGVKYVIGPVGDAQVASVARVLDGSDVFYLYYGFNQEKLGVNSLGVLGMPTPEQRLPVLFRHLREEEGAVTLLVVAYGTEEGIRRKAKVEYVAGELGFELRSLSRFDVSEETFDLDMEPEGVRRRVARVAEIAPDALVLAGFPPEAFVVLVDRLRAEGYAGLICAQNSQDARTLARLGAAADGVFYVGGSPPDGLNSEYYAALKSRYFELEGEWSEVADAKLYALEFILACLRHAGDAAFEDTSAIYRAVGRIEFRDPFYADERKVPVTGGETAGRPWQIHTPIRVSKMSGGEALLVGESYGPLD